MSDPVELVFTQQLGGVSAAPYDELNLALVDGDDPAARERNLALVTADFASADRIADMRQVHGAHVHTYDGSEHPEADAIVTAEAGVTLMVRVADCVPVLLADSERGVIGAVHSGRPGMVAGVVSAAVTRMRQLGAEDITAWIGPHVCGRCYEVPTQMHEDAADVVPAARSTTSWGTPALDIGAGVRSQLEAQDCRVVDVAACTRETPSLYSYRRDGAAAGRLAGLIRRRP